MADSRAGGHRTMTLASTTTAGAVVAGAGVNVTSGIDHFEFATFYLDVTAAATDVGDTLNVYLQMSPDGGTTWDDFASFTQVLGNGGAKNFVVRWVAGMAPDREIGARQDAALAAGTVLQGGLIGPDIRVQWVVVDADADSAFTFSVRGEFGGGRQV